MASIGPSGAIRHAMAALAVLIAVIHFALPDIAQAEPRRRALVIGNDVYEFQPALAKAVGDAHAMRAALEKLGFEVRLAENLGYGEMVGTLADFQASISPGDTVTFHFSGHGVAANGRNYLLPVDFPVAESGRQGEVTLPRLAFDAGEIVDGLRAQGAALTLAVFDACRDNALTSGTRSIGMSRGLVRMDPPRGVFVMFSAGPGELAADRLTDDDPAETSVFTRVFIPILETPGLTLVEIAKRTQVKVSELAATVDHQQFPDYSDRVIGDVVLMPRAEPETSAAPTPINPSLVLPEVAAVAPTTTPPSSETAQGPSPADPDAALCDSMAGDPYDPLLPPSVDRTRLFDLEWAIDFASALDAGQSSPPASDAQPLARIREAIAACDAARDRNPGEKRFIYQYTRALCLSGTTDRCAEATGPLATLDYPSAAKFLAFVTLSTISQESAASGLAGMLQELHLNSWFGLPDADLSDSSALAQRVRDSFASASAGGDREASAFLLLFDEEDHARRIARLQIAGTDGFPIGLPAVTTFVGLQFNMTPELRTLLNTAHQQGSRFATLMLLSDDEADKTPENFKRAKEMLEPLVAAGSLMAASILQKVEADEARLASAPAATETPAAPSASSGIDFGDDASTYAKNGLCDDWRFTGPGMTDTTLIYSDIGHDATDCRTAFEGGRLTLR